MAESSDSSVTNKVIAQKQKTVTVPTESTKPAKTEKAVLLIEDIKEDILPLSYRNLLDELWKRGTSPSSESDIIVLLIYIMMLEEGFVPLCFGSNHSDVEFNWSQILELSTNIPYDWKCNNQRYEIHFVLPAQRYNIIRLVCTKIEDDLIVNCAVKGAESDGYSMLVDPRQYVVISATNLRRRYQNIRHLAVGFKDKVAGLVKRDVLKVPSKFHKLPPEIFLYISRYVSIKNVVRALDID